MEKEITNNNYSAGAVSVTIVGERENNKLFPLITLHDFGFDHEAQFRSLERSGEDADKFFAQFVTYHIDLPGLSFTFLVCVSLSLSHLLSLSLSLSLSWSLFYDHFLFYFSKWR